MSALPGDSDIDLFRYCNRVINFNAQISSGALDPSVTEQQLNSTEVAGPTIDHGSFGSAK